MHRSRFFGLISDGVAGFFLFAMAILLCPQYGFGWCVGSTDTTSPSSSVLIFPGQPLYV